MSKWINGSESASGYDASVTVQQQAAKWAAFIVAETEKAPADSGWSRETPYSVTYGHGWTEYMLAGGGPSAFFRVCRDREGEVEYGIVQYSEGNQAFEVLSRRTTERAHALLTRNSGEAADPDA